jgi:hypothetical protein
MTHYMPVALHEMQEEINNFFNHLESLKDSRGLLFVVKYVKESRTHIMSFLSGTPSQTGDLVSLSASGWPKWLSSFQKWANEPEKLKVLFTLLVCLRHLRFTPVLDTSTIVKPSLSTGLDSRLIDYALRLLRIGPISSEWTKLHFSTKSGPLGQAMITSAIEAALLPKETHRQLILLGGKEPVSMISELLAPFDILPDSISRF